MILSVENGTFGYTKERAVLNNVSFTVKSGDLVAVLGPNGAGKTTLLRCIMGFLKWQSGKSTINGNDISKLTAKELWSIIAYVPQAKAQALSYTVHDMIMLGRSGKIGTFSTPSQSDIDVVSEVIKKLGIKDICEKSCTELSGGELQMVLIARALASEPKVLILDEPESNLDFKNQLLVLDTISSLAKSGMICIFNTHYPNHALARANKSLLLDKNGGVMFGDTQRVITEENIEKAFGVKAVIGEIETAYSTLHDVIAVSPSENSQGKMPFSENGGYSLAVVSIAVRGNAADEVNTILHEYGKYVIGRMGLPNKEYSVNIINLTLDGPSDKLKTLTLRLSKLPDVSVKTVYIEKE